MIYDIPEGHISPLYVVAYGRRIRVLSIATSVDEANKAMAARPGLALLAEYGTVALLADRDDMGRDLGGVERAAGAVAGMLVRDRVSGDWTLPAESTGAVRALREALGIVPIPRELPLRGGSQSDR